MGSAIQGGKFNFNSIVFLKRIKKRGGVNRSTDEFGLKKGSAKGLMRKIERISKIRNDRIADQL